MHSICPDIDGDDGLGNIQDFVHTHGNGGMSDDAFQFLINLVCYEADTDVCFYPPLCEVEYFWSIIDKKFLKNLEVSETFPNMHNITIL